MGLISGLRDGLSAFHYKLMDLVETLECLDRAPRKKLTRKQLLLNSSST
jgi:hypothetical protein